MAKLLVYSSSAGSGKTYTLTRNYLQLLLSSPEPTYFRHILAITFTNDAANEMKERILGSLEQLAAARPEEDFPQTLAQEINIAPEVLIERAQKAQEALLQDYTDFQVKTIDSFMNQVVQQFTEDLDLPFHFETNLEADPWLLEAVDLVLEKLNTDVTTTLDKALIQMAEAVVHQNKSWTSIRQVLKDTSSDFLNDQHYFQINRLEELQPADFQIIAKQIKEALDKNLQKLKAWGEAGEKLLQAAEVSPTDFYQGNKGLGAFFTKLREDPEEWAFKETVSSYYAETVDSNKWTSAKAPESVKKAIAGIQEELANLFQQYRTYLYEEAPRLNILAQIEKELYKLPFILHIKQAFEEVLQANNQVHIADFNRKILAIVLNEPVPFIYERLGEKFHHLLIDEFQDTSELQFFNLLPLIENGISQGFFSLVVGDAKQAIYRWRGGKMSLLVHLANNQVAELLQNPLITDIQRAQFFSLTHAIERANLTTNYRSAREIIDFNNTLFAFLLENEQNQYPFLAEVYSDYFQATPDSSPSGGRVEIVRASKEAWKEETRQQLLHLRTSGYTWGDMACLFRSNKDASELAEYLVAHEIPIATSDSLLLHKAWEIQVLIGLLEAEANPQRPELRVGPLALFAQRVCPVQATPTWLSSLATITSGEEALTFWEDLGISLPPFFASHHLYAQVEAWATALGLFGTHGRTEYLVAFLEFILQATTQQGSQLLDFLALWQKKKASLSVQTTAKAEAVTIQTVHKAKGLAYPVVLLPAVDWSMTPKNNSKVWLDLTPLEEPLLAVTSEEEGTRRLTTAPLTLKKEEIPSPLFAQKSEERMQIYLETLNMLYVALTRPQEKLWISIAEPSKTPTETINYLIHSFLEANNYPQEEPWLVSAGQDGPLRPQPNPEESIASPGEASPLVWQGMTVHPQEKLRLRRSSDRFFEVDSPDRSKDRGTRIHTLLAEIASLEEVGPAIRRAHYAGWVTAEEMESLQQEVTDWLQMPALAPYFAPGLPLDRERDLLLPGGQTLRPDRVVYFPDRTVILDFKTGQPSTKHPAQLQQYAGAFEKMKFPAVEAWLIYLDEQTVRQVYPLSIPS